MRKPKRNPIIERGAEYLTMGYLMRRNIRTYQARPNNPGYDFICVHPDPAKAKRKIRVQVKSRRSPDADKSILLGRSLGGYDFLVAVLMNVGRGNPEFYTFPRAWVEAHHIRESWGRKLRLRQLPVEAYRNEEGFERIARALGIPRPRA